MLVDGISRARLHPDDQLSKGGQELRLHIGEEISICLYLLIAKYLAIRFYGTGYVYFMRWVGVRSTVAIFEAAVPASTNTVCNLFLRAGLVLPFLNHTWRIGHGYDKNLVSMYIDPWSLQSWVSLINFHSSGQVHPWHLNISYISCLFESEHGCYTNR